MRLCCAQVFTRRLKLVGLLIKIMRRLLLSPQPKVPRVDLFKLKPLKSMHYTLDTQYRADRQLARALSELFFFAERLAIEWSLERAFAAHMREKHEILEQLVQTSRLLATISSMCLKAVPPFTGNTPSTTAPSRAGTQQKKRSKGKKADDDDDDDDDIPSLEPCNINDSEPPS